MSPSLASLGKVTGNRVAFFLPTGNFERDFEAIHALSSLLRETALMSSERVKRNALPKLGRLILILAGFVAQLAFALRAASSWKAMLICSVLRLWHLPFGMLLSPVQTVWLLSPRACKELGESR